MGQRRIQIGLHYVGGNALRRGNGDTNRLVVRAVMLCAHGASKFQ